MIGPYDSRPSSGEMILGIYFKKIPGYTLGGKNFVAVKDVAFAIANSITLGQKGQCYILGHENLSYKEAFEKISSVLNAPALKFKLSTGLVRFYGKTNSFLGKFLPFHPKISRELAILASESHFYSSEKAITELKMPQTPLEIAIAECYAWFDENNYLKKVK
jgi:dihydroflavonol-4-reductase